MSENPTQFNAVSNCNKYLFFYIKHNQSVTGSLWLWSWPHTGEISFWQTQIIRRSHGHLIFIMEITIPVKTVFVLCLFGLGSCFTVHWHWTILGLISSLVHFTVMNMDKVDCHLCTSLYNKLETCILLYFVMSFSVCESLFHHHEPMIHVGWKINQSIQYDTDCLKSCMWLQLLAISGVEILNQLLPFLISYAFHMCRDSQDIRACHPGGCYWECYTAALSCTRWHCDKMAPI